MKNKFSILVLFCSIITLEFTSSAFAACGPYTLPNSNIPFSWFCKYDLPGIGCKLGEDPKTCCTRLAKEKIAAKCRDVFAKMKCKPTKGKCTYTSGGIKCGGMCNFKDSIDSGSCVDGSYTLNVLPGGAGTGGFTTNATLSAKRTCKYECGPAGATISSSLSLEDGSDLGEPLNPDLQALYDFIYSDAVESENLSCEIEPGPVGSITVY